MRRGRKGERYKMINTHQHNTTHYLPVSMSCSIASPKEDLKIPKTKGIGAQQKVRREGGRTGTKICCQVKG